MAYHTDLVVIIIVEIYIIRPDMNETYHYMYSVLCLSIIILVYTTYNTLHAQIHVRYNLANYHNKSSEQANLTIRSVLWLFPLCG